MASLKNIKMEKRPDNEPKFNIKNKVDRKILFFVITSSIVLIALIIVFIVLFIKVGAI